MPILPLLLALPVTGMGATPPCRPAQIAVTTDGEDGAFDGMSHSGTLLVVRNTGRVSCGMPGLPQVIFLSRRGRALPIARTAPAFMHPGPVVLPVVLAPGAIASTPLAWIAGPVFDRNRCYDPVRIRLRFADGATTAALHAHICGAAGKPAGFTQPPLQPGRAQR